MKIAVITPVFSFAGVPLAQVRFARALARRGHDVELVIGHIDSAYEFPELSGVKVTELNKKRVRGMLTPICAYIRRNRPDVIFSAEDHLNSIVLLAAILVNSKAKISCSSRVTPFDTYSRIPFSKRWFLKYFVKSVMWRADALTCVSKDMVDQYRLVFKNSRHVCVYNIVDDVASRQRMTETADHEWLLSKSCPVLIGAGQLAPWKGFEYVICAVKLVTQERPVRLIILGDGALRSQLQGLIEKLGLQESVQLLGYVENPLKFFEKADVFVLSSHVEGLPNVLVEAMMCGCTPVATDCPTGPREVLQDGKYGYLVPLRDPKALAAGIVQALDHRIPRAQLDEAIRPFKEELVIDKHFEVLGLSAANAV